MAEEDGTAAAQRASEQARLRKERREAKIKAGGSARLNKISGIGGRIVGESESVPDPPVEPLPEVQRSEPVPSQRVVPPTFSDAQLRQMMQTGSGTDAGAGEEDDALMKIMSQMMSGLNDPSSSPPNFPFQQPGQQGTANKDGYTLAFRLLHAVLSLGLGLYLTLMLLTPRFSGSRADREKQSFTTSSGDEAHRRLLFFWVFATGEAVLLSSRFFLDKSRQPPPGLLWSAVGFLPDPVRGYVSVVLRYGQIFMTVRADILACVFVLGVVCWCRS
ncbi:hypothetical protein CP533_1021 [Ophiocordyceps camponoti-saundersi (nom. inval.)]|nr:hypothetical protein CP533_1021 [Ophiocordyceps camponoti-saundersi (nom. inval.)]